MVYELQKFRNYLLGGQLKMFNDHSALMYLVNKPMLEGKICQWILLFHEFDFEIVVKLGRLNVGPDHLSCTETGEEPANIDDGLMDAQLFRVDIADDHNASIIQFLETRVVLEEMTTSQKK